jgi:hypothetical protein
MALGDTPRGGGAREMFQIYLPPNTIPNGGDFSVNPVVPFARLVITGPTSDNNFELQPDGSSVWEIPAGVLWSIRLE